MSAPRRPPVPPELQRGYLTAAAGLRPIQGEVREEPEDFQVEEVPLYAPAGEGAHLYLWVEKRGIPTDEAVRRISRRLGIPRRDVGHAGLKDARALTRQWLSIPAPRQAEPGAELPALDDGQLRVLEARRHKNKLKVGHLLGNRFRLRLRGGAGPDGVGATDARAALELLARRGVPNYFGLQRFGVERHTHLLGQALVREDPARLVALLLTGAGRPGDPQPGGRMGEAREAARASDWTRAAELLPPSLAAESALARALARGASVEQAARAIGGKWTGFYAAAWQSWLFNAYLTRRLERIDALEAGEVATLHRNGAAFLVEDPAREAPRCAAFEISPSGPLFGRRLLRPAEGSGPRADEDALLAELAPGIDPEVGEALGARPQGERRPLRIALRELVVEVEGPDLILGFFLPRGSYATSVLEELFQRQTD